MKQVKKEVVLEKLFRLSVILKGLDGLLETVGGILLFLVNPQMINTTVAWLTQHELSEDPHDVLANLLVSLAAHISLKVQIFSGIYLLAHGLIKIVLVLSLLKNKLWSYPSAIIFLIIFIFYQLYRFAVGHSPMMLALTVFDMLVVALVWNEYRVLRAKISSA